MVAVVRSGFLCAGVDPYVGVLWSGCSFYWLGRDGGFMAGGSLGGCQILRSCIRFGFHLSGWLRQTPCGFEIFQM